LVNVVLDRDHVALERRVRLVDPFDHREVGVEQGLGRRTDLLAATGRELDDVATHLLELLVERPAALDHGVLLRTATVLGLPPSRVESDKARSVRAAPQALFIPRSPPSHRDLTVRPDRVPTMITTGALGGPHRQPRCWRDPPLREVDVSTTQQHGASSGAEQVDVAEKDERMAMPTVTVRPAGDDESGPAQPEPGADEVVFEVRDLTVRYSGQVAVDSVSLDVHAHQITALIGPSGCGKSTLLRSFNRMNDLVTGAQVSGCLAYHGHDLYAADVDAVEVRRRIGMVFQRPNPFPKSIYDNIAFGPRISGKRKGLDDIVERSLQHAALWDEVKG